MLTLKDKLELFKLAKKPRKQIRLRLEVITNNLNLPSLHRTYKLLDDPSSEKHKKVAMNINNFKKIDKTKHNMTSVCRTYENETDLNQDIKTKTFYRNSIGEKENTRKNVNQRTKSKDKSGRLYHSNKNREFLLKDFDFHMSREQKREKLEQENLLKARQNYTYLQKEKAKESWQLIKLKNEFSGLKNMNKIYRAQLENAKKVEKIACNANRMSQLLLKTQEIKDSIK